MISPGSARSADHFDLGRGAILEAIEDQLDPRGDAKLVENAKEVIADDYLLAAGWQARTIAITGYLLTALLALTGWFVTQSSWRSSVMLAAGIVGALLVIVCWMAALRPGAMKQTRYRAQL
jgi:VIT1/CCC1 family predicted Fe2+/Mn2+ transporter